MVRCVTNMTERSGESIAATPKPPYTAVIFSSVRTDGDNGYAATAFRMAVLAAEQPGYLGMETAHEQIGITVSYWQTEEHARAWKRVTEHAEAQRQGREVWYSQYVVRIATVVREYGG